MLAYTLKELSQRSKISKPTLYRQIAAGKIVARKVGQRTIVLHTDAEAWLSSLEKMPAAASSRK